MARRLPGSPGWHVPGKGGSDCGDCSSGILETGRGLHERLLRRIGGERGEDSLYSGWLGTARNFHRLYCGFARDQLRHYPSARMESAGRDQCRNESKLRFARERFTRVQLEFTAVGREERL